MNKHCKTNCNNACKVLFRIKQRNTKQQQNKQEMSLKKTNGVGLKIEENITHG